MLRLLILGVKCPWKVTERLTWSLIAKGTCETLQAGPYLESGYYCGKSVEIHTTTYPNIGLPTRRHKSV
ncbi:MAG: hypothetical protein WBV70_02500 [Candidatus Bathyarchaeia archaeon]